MRVCTRREARAKRLVGLASCILVVLDGGGGGEGGVAAGL